MIVATCCQRCGAALEQTGLMLGIGQEELVLLVNPEHECPNVRLESIKREGA
jgi:hypothetical protein